MISAVMLFPLPLIPVSQAGTKSGQGKDGTSIGLLYLSVTCFTELTLEDPSKRSDCCKHHEDQHLLQSKDRLTPKETSYRVRLQKMTVETLSPDPPIVPIKASVSRLLSDHMTEVTDDDTKPSVGYDESLDAGNNDDNDDRVSRLEKELMKERLARDSMRDEYEARMKVLNSKLDILQRELQNQAGENPPQRPMTHEADLQPGTPREEEESLSAHREKIDKMHTKILFLEKTIRDQSEHNSQLLNQMLSLQGNIQVYCRVRPLTVHERSRGCNTVIEAMSETDCGCFDPRHRTWKSFAFDRTWSSAQSQSKVFRDVEPLALSVVDGFDACIFAYGQTGSGKTFTMEGLPEEDQHGISYRTIEKLFQLLRDRQAQHNFNQRRLETTDTDHKESTFSYNLELGMLEIYNEEIFDLLVGPTMGEKKEGARQVRGKSSLDIRRNPDGRMEVPGLTKERANTIDEVMELLKRGNKNRATASTNMNEHSSRSHMVLTIDVSSSVGETLENQGTLFLVDLAGSERIRKSKSEGEQLKEAGFINKSLSALGNVMQALDKRQSHIPYRDSKLTYLLQNSLGGNSRTLMIVTISPVAESRDESINALQFATRVRSIEMDAIAQRNVTSKNLEENVRILEEELQKVTQAKAKTDKELKIQKKTNSQIQMQLDQLVKARQQNRADTQELQDLRERSEDLLSRWQEEQKIWDQTRQNYESLQDKLLEASEQIHMLQNELGGDRGTSSHENASSDRSSLSEAEIASIRQKVLDLLEKHDKSKVDRIDNLMQTFKGKENILLQKIARRYLGTSPATSSPPEESPGSSSSGAWGMAKLIIPLLIIVPFLIFKHSQKQPSREIADL